MASPRSMWTGLLRYGLLNIPVSVGKAWQDQRETSLKTVCSKHKTLIDRSERCGGCEGPPEGKLKAVEVNGKFRPLNEAEYAAIEDATKSPTLDVLDAQPMAELPLIYATGTYFLRPDKKTPGAEKVFGLLVDALTQTGYGLVVKWCTSSRQKLCVIHTDGDVLVMRTVPMVDELREPGDQELAHTAGESDDQQVAMLVQLFEATRNSDGFDHAAYEDEGLALRAEAVEKILAGKPGKKAPKPKAEQVPDIMATLQASITEKQKEKA